jgi:aspartyl-tRNA(Asn)/glutamyl-tRNA(Gln) amidotransferase subunit C
MTTRISETLVRHVAHLARLKLTSEEISRFGEQLGTVLEYMDKLGEVDITGVEPTAHPLPACNVFRLDRPSETLGVEKVLANAPQREGDYFRVPKVLD